MRVFRARCAALILPALVVLAVAGCDQIENVTSGGGGKKAIPTQSASGTIAANSASSGAQNDANGADAAHADSDSSADVASDASNLKTFDDILAEAGVEEDTEDEDPGSDDASNPFANRNVEQYPRLPRNVTWKPVSSSSGDNLTIILWGRGGGEKNYEQGTLRIAYNGGVKYPRREERRQDGAPRFLFDVKGGWFEGKDPVLFWNLGAYRIVHPERRQGKNEE